MKGMHFKSEIAQRTLSDLRYGYLPYWCGYLNNIPIAS